MDPPGPPPPSASLEQSRLQGHLGHLTAHEESAFKAFKSLCAEQGFFKLADGQSPASHDDGTLVFVISNQILLCRALPVANHSHSRYLRARKFVPQDAFVQFKDTEIWRKENQLDALYEKIDIHDYQEARSVVS